MRLKSLIILSMFRGIECSIYQTELTLKDEMEKHNKFVSDDCRRVHDYDEFINTFLFMLGKETLKLIKKSLDLGIIHKK